MLIMILIIMIIIMIIIIIIIAYGMRRANPRVSVKRGTEVQELTRALM